MEEQKRFEERYQTGATPWDTLVSGPKALIPGRFLDFGCGTGTSCITVARLGWQAVGVDFAASALERAEQKARALADEIARAGGSVRFCQADVTRLEFSPAEEQFSLLLDAGCLNNIQPGLRMDYARVVARQARMGALFLLYVHLPDEQSSVPAGATEEEVDQLFLPGFRLERRTLGITPMLPGRSAMWNWLVRV
jgi:SAM-dependent methyltransferase